MSVHLYLVTELKTTCFSGGKAYYRLLCDECAGNVDGKKFSLCKETEVSRTCERCDTMLSNKEHWDYEEIGILPTRDWGWFKELVKINEEGGRGL